MRTEKKKGEIPPCPIEILSTEKVNTLVAEIEQEKEEEAEKKKQQKD